ncbi:MAG: hypothetical protein H0X29_12065 [Parachlamydiaceae bacterium]|nr:hypothetical protein [Parachlamydiaceae bacterium]
MCKDVLQVAKSSILSFQKFAKSASYSKPYQPISTELKGIFNIVVGSAVTLVCPCLKCARAQRLYNIHAKFAKRAMIQGVIDLCPALIITATVGGASLAFRHWSRC